MKSSTPYEDHANRCRALAGEATSTEDREILLKIADTWDWIARDYEPAEPAQANGGGRRLKLAK